MSSFGTESTALRTLWCALLATLVLSAPAGAEDQHRVADEYARQVTAAQTIAALGAELFGERIDRYSGRTEFVATDVSLPGNDPLPVRIGRRFVAEDRGGVSFVRAFGDWDLELPRLHGIFARTAGSTNSGWLSSMPVPTQRCSIWGEFQAPPPDASGSQGGTFTASEYWAGNWLHVPERASRAAGHCAGEPAAADGWRGVLPCDAGAVVLLLPAGDGERCEG